MTLSAAQSAQPNGSRLAAVLILVACGAAFAAPADVHARRDAPPLELADTLASVRRHHPIIASAAQELRAAQGEALSSRGGFDPVLQAEGSVRTGGYYDLRQLDVALRQPTPLWGTEIFAGYRLGLGGDRRWPTYDPDETLAGGEVRAGVRVPLWRGGPIDSRRARVRIADRAVEAAGWDREATRLELELAAVDAYWRWLASVRALEVARDQVALAREREAQLRRQLAAGSVPAIEVTDNERMVLERSAEVIRARRAVEQAALDLSLFLRDADGQPVVAPEDWAPPGPQAPPDPAIDEERVRQRIARCHPDVARLRAELAAQGVRVDLAENAVAPRIDASLQVARDLGSPSRNDTLPGTELKAGIMFSLPLPLRTERGDLGAARANLAQGRETLRWLTDQLTRAVADAASRVRATHERAAMTDRLVEAAEALADGERKRLQAGASNLLFVNLRELAAADARLRRIEARAAAHAAWAHWQLLAEIPCTAP